MKGCYLEAHTLCALKMYALNLIYNRAPPSHNKMGVPLKIINSTSIAALLFFM